jgi:RNA recognition motif-containing protein
MNIYVGNVSHEVSEKDLQQAFEGFGQGESVRIIKEVYSGRSKGFGFVKMSGKAKAHSAIDGLNGKALKGWTIKVDKARSRSESGRGGGRQSGWRRPY